MTARTRGRSGISTHAPRTGSDTPCGTRWKNTSSTNFNPRSPHGERRFRQVRPAGAARHFNPRSPHGERRIPYNKLDCQAFVISTHAPRTGSDKPQYLGDDGLINFNPRSPHGERRRRRQEACRRPYFNPRSPHGERLQKPAAFPQRGEFQPTLPARGATRASLKRESTKDNFNPRSPHGERRVLRHA